MKLVLEINNLTASRLDKNFIRRVVLETIKKSRFEFLKNKSVSVSVAAVKPPEIRKLNRRYRHIDKTTDILSFPEYPDKADLKKEEKNGIFLGELVLCYNRIKRNARSGKTPLKKELAFVVSHGTLHLLGMKHGQKMHGIQEKISDSIRR